MRAPRKTSRRAAEARPEKAEGIYAGVSRKRDLIVGNLKRVPLAAEYDEALRVMEDYLRTHGKRCTVERRFVLEMLYQLTQPVDIGTLHSLVCAEAGNVSLTTMYSTLELLVQLHLARRFELVSHGMAFFERTLGSEPHGYVVCSECGAISILRQPDLLSGLQPQLPRGFAPDDYTLIVRGLCSKCQRRLRKKTKETKTI